MTEPTFAERRMSFGSAAASYADLRPGYPPEVLRWILDGATRPVREAADVGAGAGAFTQGLLEAGLAVTAYDPDAGMLEELARRVPSVPRVVAPAEALPLLDDAVDLLTVAQAWHWFDKPAAAREFVRVVRPGGVIGLVWNIRDDRVPWMGAMSDLIEGEDSMRASRVDALAEIRAVHPDVVHAEFSHVVAMTPEDIVRLAATFSYVRLRSDSTSVYAALRGLLATHPDTAGLAHIDVPYVTATYRILVT
jgi:SAM-dependent methyltransferase